MAGTPPPVRRPETVRPRSDQAGDPDGDPGPLSRQDLERVEEQLAQLAGLAGASALRDPALRACLVRWPGRGPALNHLERVRWPSGAAEIDALIERLARRLRESADRPAIVVAHGLTEPADLAARLLDLGWHAMLHESVLWTRRAAIVPHLDPLLRIEAVTAASAPLHEALERSIFRLDASLAEIRLSAVRRAIEAGRLRAYVVRLDDEPIATARLWTFGDLACLDGVGVVPGARRRGYGTLVATIATRAALATGHRLVWLEVAEDNPGARALYERLDFRPAFDWRLFVR
jgi:ribosomal protein S18 acetylase RimI-like enzyme